MTMMIGPKSSLNFYASAADNSKQRASCFRVVRPFVRCPLTRFAA